MAVFETAYQKTGSREGGYCFNAKDPGGETNYGITKYVATKWGYTGEMRTLPKEIAEGIYKKEYWDSLHLDSVNDQDVANEIFDTGVLCGIGTSAIFLQKVLNAFNLEGERWNDLKEDGSVGMATITALNKSIEDGFSDEIMKALNCLQGAHFIDISRKNPNLEEFILGWFRNRIGLN